MDTSSDNVTKVLKETPGDESIIVELENTRDPKESEIVEIIEIIEEVEDVEELEEVEEVEEQTDQDSIEDTTVDNPTVRETENVKHKNHSKHDQTLEEHNYNEEEKVVSKGSQEKNPLKHSSDFESKPAKKQVIKYDVDEDWQDEEMEQLEDMDEDMDQNSDITNHSQDTVNGDKKAVHKERNTFSSHLNKVESRCNEKSKLGQEFSNNIHSIENVDNVGHEIVKNVENNLLYTVLGTKKSASTSRTSQSEAQYIKVEQLNENTIPVEGTIYYEGDNMETLYVAQSVDENEQYQYDASLDQDEQVWEAANSDTTQNQEEENSQDQIFLHEDEDGQLYFKDDNGELQRVYLTADGNYAIADNSDDQDSKESLAKSQQSTKSADDYALPDADAKSAISNKQNLLVPASTLNDLDNEDNTVTISLIISEDEHGQKRTQVIIPTTDNLKCDICNKSFKTSFQLLRHNRLKHAREEDITTRNFPCDLCPKRYPDRNSLARHRKTHTGDRPFQCLECHKNFPTATALRRHLTLHNSQSRPLPCIYCGRRFMEKASLAKHEQSHLAGDQRTHTCDICQKSFSDATDLSLHKKYHDPDKKFDCEVCGREFSRLNNLQRHMTVHQQQGANEEILSCDICGITYKFMSSLTRHMVTTHMNPEKMRQQAEEQRRKRENNYRRYLENRKIYETQHSAGYGTKRNYHHNSRILSGSNDEAA